MMATKFPKVGDVLPSRARELIYEFFIARLRESGVNDYNQFMYREEHVWPDIKDQNSWVTSQAWSIFEQARKDFDNQHPVCWSNALQKSWRKGLNDPEIVPEGP